MNHSSYLQAFEQTSWQTLVFAERPRRVGLMKVIPQPGARPVVLRIHRNFPVEFLLGPLSSFLAYGGYAAEARMGAYDDALSFPEARDADVELVLLDFCRYRNRMGTDELAAWLGERIRELRGHTRAPILVGAGEPPFGELFDELLARALDGLAGVRLVPRQSLVRELGDAYWDTRLQTVGATRLSDAAYLALARALGLVWIPAALAPRLKALALDLDNTLYRGVLGEDGPEGVEVGETYAALHHRILELKEEGFFLALVSRNEPADVEALFKARPDMLLHREHFSAFEISWGPKAAALVRVAEKLRIGLDAILFVDDNAGELGAVAAAHPEIHLLHAGEPAETLRGLRWYPGLLRWSQGGADGVRAADLAASEARTSLATETMDPMAYLRSLGVKLGFSLDRDSQLVRLAELSCKTNQFNLSLRRLSEVDVAKRLDDPECATVGASLSDRLSDSGNILSLFARRIGNTLVVEDLCISCRALGRHLEDVLVVAAVNRVLDRLPAERVAFDYVLGPRNAPARDWLARFSDAHMEEQGQIVMTWDREARQRELANLPVEMVWN